MLYQNHKKTSLKLSKPEAESPNKLVPVIKLNVNRNKLGGIHVFLLYFMNLLQWVSKTRQEYVISRSRAEYI